MVDVRRPNGCLATQQAALSYHLLGLFSLLKLCNSLLLCCNFLVCILLKIEDDTIQLKIFGQNNYF